MQYTRKSNTWYYKMGDLRVNEVKTNDARKRLTQILNNTKNKTYHVTDDEFENLLNMLTSGNNDDADLAVSIIKTNAIFKEEHKNILLTDKYFFVICGLRTFTLKDIGDIL